MRLAAVSKRHLLAILLLCSLAMSFTGWRESNPLRSATRFVLAPLGDAPMYAALKLQAALARRPEPRLSDEESDRLREENDGLRRLAYYWQARSEEFQRQVRQLANFQEMYAPTADLSCELIAAHVVGAGSLPYDRTRVLGGGARQGIRPGAAVTTREIATNRSKALPEKLAVVNESSLVGRIVDSGAFTARLQLVTDREFRINGRIRRVILPDRPRTVTVVEGDLPRTAPLEPKDNVPIDVLAVGDGADMVVAPDVKAYHNVLPGDELWASAEKEFLPVDIRIGKVEKVELNEKDSRRVTVYVRPHADVAAVRDVFILSPLAAQPGRP